MSVFSLQHQVKKIADKELQFQQNVIEHNEPPHLQNVRLVDTEIRVTDYRDGFFYGVGSERTLEVYKSANGEEWEKVADLPEGDPDRGGNWANFVIASDTNRLIVGLHNGHIFVSDEEQVFSDTSTIDDLTQTHPEFCYFKYRNIIGINTYTNHGLEYDHKAYLSVDNGETFNEVFNNERLEELPQLPEPERYHLHDMEYDPYSGLLYLWQGDFENRMLLFSKDFGKNWKAINVQRGQLSNATQILATKSGILLGADTRPGGIAKIHLNRANKTSPEIKFENYDLNYWVFDDDGRYIATKRWIDRNKGVYIMGFKSEYDDGFGRIAFSFDGEKWHEIYKDTNQGDRNGFGGVVYGNGKLIANQLIDNDYHRTFIAEVELD